MSEGITMKRVVITLGMIVCANLFAVHDCDKDVETLQSLQDELSKAVAYRDGGVWGRKQTIQSFMELHAQFATALSSIKQATVLSGDPLDQAKFFNYHKDVLGMPQRKELVAMLEGVVRDIYADYDKYSDTHYLTGLLNYTANSHATTLLWETVMDEYSRPRQKILLESGASPSDTQYTFESVYDSVSERLKDVLMKKNACLMQRAIDKRSHSLMRLVSDHDASLNMYHTYTMEIPHPHATDGLRVNVNPLTAAFFNLQPRGNDNQNTPWRDTIELMLNNGSSLCRDPRALWLPYFLATIRTNKNDIAQERRIVERVVAHRSPLKQLKLGLLVVGHCITKKWLSDKNGWKQIKILLDEALEKNITDRLAPRDHTAEGALDAMFTNVFAARNAIVKLARGLATRGNGKYATSKPEISGLCTNLFRAHSRLAACLKPDQKTHDFLIRYKQQLTSTKGASDVKCELLDPMTKGPITAQYLYAWSQNSILTGLLHAVSGAREFGSDELLVKNWCKGDELFSLQKMLLDRGAKPAYKRYAWDASAKAPLFKERHLMHRALDTLDEPLMRLLCSRGTKNKLCEYHCDTVQGLHCKQPISPLFSMLYTSCLPLCTQDQNIYAMMYALMQKGADINRPSPDGALFLSRFLRSLHRPMNQRDRQEAITMFHNLLHCKPSALQLKAALDVARMRPNDGQEVIKTMLKKVIKRDQGLSAMFASRKISLLETPMSDHDWGVVEHALRNALKRAP